MTPVVGLCLREDADNLAVAVEGGLLVDHGTGLPAAARELTRLTTIVGGDSGVVERLTPLFRTFSKEVVHVGPAGAGQYAKLFDNTLMMNHKNVLDVLRSGSAGSFVLEAIGPVVTSANVGHLRRARPVVEA
ncbi:MAG: hypothetical protein QOI78_714 [Actinomycetota bacterium]|nr:hypothetical protein [Actinomycetota bacterium]